MLTKKTSETLYLLDTHIWLWLLTGDQKLITSGYVKTIETAARQHALRVSLISIWETGMLEAKGRISLGENIYGWMDKALALPGIRVEPLNEQIMLESTRLPGAFHGDPADRLIIATARHINACLITCDKDILKYAQKKHVNVLR